jgi:glycerophosphoryl diester phosphodiesterase
MGGSESPTLKGAASSPMPRLFQIGAALTLASALISSGGGLSHSGVEIIAHRGASFDAPENTIASFNLGWGQKADANELDVHLSKDGRLVVIHDPNTQRTTGVPRVVASSTLAQLRKLDAGAWKDWRWSGERLPTLADVAATIPEGKRLFVHIKCGSEVLPEMRRVLTSSGKRLSQFAIIGFDYTTMQQVKKQFPALEVYWLIAPSIVRNGATPTLEELVDLARAAGFDGLDLEYHFPIDRDVVAKIKAAGLRVYVWIVDDPTVAWDLVGAGVDGITTDRPEWLRTQLSYLRPR